MKFSILILIIQFSLFAEAKEISKKSIFEKISFKEALTKAKKEKKFIFLDAYADWCTPCIWMDENVYKDAEVHSAMKDKFISIQIDFDKEEFSLKEKLKIDTYPILLFFNPKGELIHRFRGPLKAKEFLEEKEKSTNPSKAYYPLKNKFDKTNISRAELFDLIYASYNAWGSVDNSILDTYLMREKDIYSAENWKIIDTFLVNLDSFTFKLLKNKKVQFQKFHGKDIVEKKFLLTQMEYYSRKEEWEKYAKIAFEYAEKYLDNDWKSLDGIAWKLSEHISDVKILKRAETLAKKSIKLEPNFLNYETHAILLLKLGKLKESHFAISTSINLAKDSGESYDSGVEILHKIIVQALEKN